MAFPRGRLRSAAVLASWLAVCSAGSLVLIRYQAAAGDASAAPSRWPRGAALRPADGSSTLVLFGHPRCPCTRATIDGLAWLRSRDGGRIKAYVVFFKPSGASPGWEKSDLWSSASAIPGVTVLADPGGAEARRFGAETSGQALLYDAGGRLLYRGGITGGRGHFGDNAGRDAVLSLALGGPGLADAPVFGCSLREAVAEREAPVHGS